MTSFRPIDSATLKQIGLLKVRDDQTGLVSQNIWTIAESRFEPGSEVYGIWDGDTPAGLLAMIDLCHPDVTPEPEDHPDSLYIWRLMVDGRHQGRKLGVAALQFAVAAARDRGRKIVWLTAVDEPGGAIPFYEAFGFRRTGRVFDDETELTLPLT